MIEFCDFRRKNNHSESPSTEFNVSGSIEFGKIKVFAVVRLPSLSAFTPLTLTRKTGEWIFAVRGLRFQANYVASDDSVSSSQ